MKLEKELIFSITKKDLDISYYSGSGAGGQHRNKSKNCVRIIHKESGVVVVGTEQKSREQNKKMAFKRLTKHKDFNKWLRLETAKRLEDNKKIEKEIDLKVQDSMKEENLLIETF